MVGVKVAQRCCIVKIEGTAIEKSNNLLAGRWGNNQRLRQDGKEDCSCASRHPLREGGIYRVRNAMGLPVSITKL